ncbi:MAG: DNA polymerase IV [Patescibacteria group bacterium]
MNFPRTIFHVDGDSFFAACEVASRPWLKGKPVVTGRERGIVSAATYEAKALGISRATRLLEVKKKFPQVIILPSDYDTYALYAQRMYDIVRRYTPLVEEYSIDECFADLTGLAEERGTTYEALAKAIKDDLETSLGLSFSVGLSVNKVAAKIASKWNKPSGLTLIPLELLPEYTAKLPIGKVWGIGRSTAIQMKKKGIVTAFDFASRDRHFVRENFPKPIQEIYEELNGGFSHDLHAGVREDQASIQRTRTFRPPSSSREFIFSELSRNVEEACVKLRRHGLFTTHISFFIKSQEFSYHGTDLSLPHATNVPQDILAALKRAFEDTFSPRGLYRATGIRLSGLTTANTLTAHLFNDTTRTDTLGEMYKAIDKVDHKYGKNMVVLGASLMSWKSRGEMEGNGPDVKNNLFRKRFGMPFLGEVR